MQLRAIGLSLSALLLADLAAAEPRTAAEIEACVAANMPSASSVQNVTLRAKDRVGTVNESRATIYWKKFEDGKSRVRMDFTEPNDLRGASVLLLERKQGARDIFMYMPDLKRVKRVTTHMMGGSIFGTNFSFEDFETIEDYAAKAKPERKEDVVIDGAPTWVLESRPAAGEFSSYTRVVEYIDPSTCTRIKTELFESGDQLRKVASSDRKTLTTSGGITYAPALTLRDLHEGTETELVINKVEVGAEIPAKLFSQASLTQGH
jgi:hypothetical protein